MILDYKGMSGTDRCCASAAIGRAAVAAAPPRSVINSRRLRALIR